MNAIDAPDPGDRRNVGVAVGLLLGEGLGFGVGTLVGMLDGCTEGETDGERVGLGVGVPGRYVGEGVPITSIVTSPFPPKSGNIKFNN